ncbi:MAG: glycosyltransferase family 39 protein [Chloroflexi bacterium]|nr:glycosyltransferase family 39 protein [Chloroflexota bacterium]
MRKLTRILTALIIGYILLAALYAVFTPKWQAPDEPAHFNYIRAIAETGGLPVLQSGDYDQDYLERIKAAKFPAAMPIDAIRYEAYQPPLYYLAATPVYLLARGAGLDATVLALRLFSVALGVGILLVAYRCVREIFPDDAFLALATIGAMATVPMHIAITASISNDAAAELVLALILLLALQRVKSSITNYQFTIYGGLLFGAALLTKSTAYVPGALLLIGAELGRVLGGKEAGEQGGILRNPKSEIFWHYSCSLSPSSPRGSFVVF